MPRRLSIPLNAEMDHHLDGEGGVGNGRNGYGQKTVITDTGKPSRAFAPASASGSWPAVRFGS
jgi:putative transposase